MRFEDKTKGEVKILDGQAQKIKRRERKKKLLESNQRLSQDMHQLRTKKMLRRFKCRIESYHWPLGGEIDAPLLSLFF